MTTTTIPRDYMFLRDLFADGGRLIIGDTPEGLWYSNTIFAKPADAALAQLLTRQGLELQPSAYWIDTPDDDDDPSEEMWSRSYPATAAAIGALFPNPDVPSVQVEPVRHAGLPALIRRYEGADLMSVFRRSDGQEVFLNQSYVQWIAGGDHTTWRCSQPEGDPLTMVTFHNLAGRLAGIVMPIRP